MSLNKGLEHIKDDPILKDFANPFPPFLGRGQKRLEQSFGRLAKLTGPMQRPACIQFKISNSRWCLTLAPRGTEVSRDTIEHPDLEIITSEDTWLSIANGQLSPLEAFAKGNLRIRGNIELARLFTRRVHQKKKKSVKRKK